METISIDDINKRLVELEEKLEPSRDPVGFLTWLVTPLEKELEVVGPPIEICPPNYAHFIRERFIYTSYEIYNRHGEIPKDWYYSIARFLLAKNMPREEKLIVSKYLTDEIKEYILDMLFKKAMESNRDVKCDEFYNPNEMDVLEYHSYRPRINGVPMHLAYESKYGTGIETPEYQMPLSMIKSYLLKKEKPPRNIADAFILKCFFDSDEYFDEPWCIDFASSLKKLYNREDWQKGYSDFFKKMDELYVEKIKSSKQVEHSVKVNNQLKNKILNSVPSDFSKLEKAIYIYERLSQILSYDPFYYIENQGHSEVRSIEEYSDENNKIVCYEFAYILADLLREIGVEYIYERNPRDGKFSRSHANLEFLVDDLVLFADSTTSVLEGDLTRIKFDDQVSGIRCQLFDKEKQEMFKKAKARVTEHLKAEEMLADLELADLEEKKGKIEIERMKEFVKRIFTSDLDNIDLVAYANEVKKRLDLEEYVYTEVYTTEEVNGKIYLGVLMNPYGEDRKRWGRLPWAEKELKEEFDIKFMLDLSDKKIYTVNSGKFISEQDYLKGKH